MPVLSRFYGITIKMYFQRAEHNPPHIHAKYGNMMAAIDIKTGEILDGKLPAKIHSLVKLWIKNNKEDLFKIWETQQFVKLPPLE